jgi:hypothetical protein
MCQRKRKEKGNLKGCVNKANRRGMMIELGKKICLPFPYYSFPFSPSSLLPLLPTLPLKRIHAGSCPNKDIAKS